MARILSKIIISLLALWAIVRCFIAELLGVTIYFPFNIVERQEVPYHRLTSLRLSIFLTFAYFGFRYIFFKQKNYIQFNF